jgi:cupin 2 domain-containing protein
MMKNIFVLPENMSATEVFEPLATGAGIKIERIISTGQSTPDGEWYDQDQAEWVMLLQGEAVLRFDDGRQYTLESGDYILIPAHDKHRVESTTSEPPCVWIAIFADMTT